MQANSSGRLWAISAFPVGIYLLKANAISTRTRCEICSKLTIKTPEWCQWRRSGVFIVNFDCILQLCSNVSIVNFENVIAGWVKRDCSHVGPLKSVTRERLALGFFYSKLRRSQPVYIYNRYSEWLTPSHLFSCEF